jgi:hypothetical protein
MRRFTGLVGRARPVAALVILAAPGGRVADRATTAHNRGRLAMRRALLSVTLVAAAALAAVVLGTGKASAYGNHAVHQVAISSSLTPNLFGPGTGGGIWLWIETRWNLRDVRRNWRLHRLGLPAQHLVHRPDGGAPGQRRGHLDFGRHNSHDQGCPDRRRSSAGRYHRAAGRPREDRQCFGVLSAGGRTTRQRRSHRCPVDPPNLRRAKGPV